MMIRSAPLRSALLGARSSSSSSSSGSRNFHNKCTSIQHGMVPISMPALSPTMTHGTLKQWTKKPGDKIDVGDVLCEIGTDKATLEFESQQEGYLATRIVDDGSENVECGICIGVMVEEKAELQSLQDEIKQYVSQHSAATSSSSSSSSSSPPAAAVVTTTQQTTTTANTAPTQATKYNVPLMPSVRILLHTYGIDPSEIKNPSGKKGRISKADVLQYLRQHPALETKRAEKVQREQRAVQEFQVVPTVAAAAAAPSSSSKTTATTTAGATSKRLSTGPKYEDIPTTQMRRVIAARLLESKQTIPHFYMTAEVRMDNLLQLKKELQDKRGVKVSVNDLVIKAVARALDEVPECNAVFNKQTQQHEIAPTVDISVAVATEGGLITPIVKNANRLSVEQISEYVKQLGAKAREGKLQPHEFQGGSFCISNLGMFGIGQFEAVINPPQAIILSVGGSQKRLVVETENNSGVDVDEWDVDADSADADQMSAVQVGTFTTFTVNCDQRAVDGADAARFLQALKRNLELI